MDSFINTAERMVLIKDMSKLIDFDLIRKTVDTLEFKRVPLNSMSVDYNLFDRPGFENIKKTFENEAVHFLRNGFNLEVGKDFEDLKITNSWAASSQPGEAHHKHVHPFSVVSGVVFIDEHPCNSNFSVELYKPNVPYYFPSKPNNVVEIGSLIKENVSLKHHLVLFLSDTSHMVKPTSKDSEVRRTVAFNTFWKGLVGIPEDLLSNHVF